MRPPPVPAAGPPAVLLLLLTLLASQRSWDVAAADTPGPCWRQRTPRDHCSPIPRDMLELLQVGGEQVVRAVLPSQVVRVPENRKPKIRSHKHILTFKLPEAKRGERLKSAELKVAVPWKLKNQSSLAKSDMAHVFLVQKNEEAGNQSTIRLDSVPINYPSREHYNVSLNFTPTVSLNVTSALFQNQQIHQPSKNPQRSTGPLHLEVHLQGNDNALPSVIPEDYDKMKNYENPITQGTEDPPQLLLFYSLGRQSQTLSSSNIDKMWRRKRSTKDEFEEESNVLWNGMAEFTRSKEMSGVKKKSPRNSCRRQPLYVDFAEINYDTWIVAPNGYEAYQCVGKCFFPVSEHLSPTKHAILQTLVHSASPRKAARACCVPTRLQSISLLYVDQNGVLTYHFNFEDMVVAECGCR